LSALTVGYRTNCFFKVAPGYLAKFFGMERAKDSKLCRSKSYVGCNVRLNEQALQRVMRRENRREEPRDNCFLVAATSRNMRELICYGADQRITVALSDVVLI